jgi:hypothetical protein
VLVVSIIIVLKSVSCYAVRLLHSNLHFLYYPYDGVAPGTYVDFVAQRNINISTRLKCSGSSPVAVTLNEGFRVKAECSSCTFTQAEMCNLKKSDCIFFDLNMSVKERSSSNVCSI